LAYLPAPGDAWVLLALAVIAAAGTATLLTSVARRRVAWPWLLWGAAWVVAGALPLSGGYPGWWANRSLPAPPGARVMLCVLADAVHPLALAALVSLRLIALALSPSAPPWIESAEPAGIAFDFVHLARLQRLVAATRQALQSGAPRLEPGA